MLKEKELEHIMLSLKVKEYLSKGGKIDVIKPQQYNKTTNNPYQHTVNDLKG